MNADGSGQAVLPVKTSRNSGLMPAWAPDGKSILYVHECHLRRAPAKGGKSRVLGIGRNNCGFTLDWQSMPSGG